MTIEYADGERERIDLRGPEEIDHMLQHYAARNYPQWVGGRRGAATWSWARDRHARGCWTSPSYREEIECLRISVRRETLIGCSA